MPLPFCPPFLGGLWPRERKRPPSALGWIAALATAQAVLRGGHGAAYGAAGATGGWDQ